MLESMLYDVKFWDHAMVTAAKILLSCLFGQLWVYSSRSQQYNPKYVQNIDDSKCKMWQLALSSSRVFNQYREEHLALCQSWRSRLKIIYVRIGSIFLVFPGTLSKTYIFVWELIRLVPNSIENLQA